MKFNEINKLWDMVCGESHEGYIITINDCFSGKIVEFFNLKGKRIGDVIEHEYSDGHYYDLLEAMGFNLPKYDTRGWLTAEKALEMFHDYVSAQKERTNR